MNFDIKSTIRKLCRQYQIKPLRRRGQNFLINHNVLNKILEAAELERDDLVLEIGAGFGFLTRELAKRVKKVIAIEIEKKFIEILKNQLQNYRNIEIIQGDVLDHECYNAIMLQCYNSCKLVANIPYNITGQVLRRFLLFSSKLKLMVLMLQKEVAERICSRPPRMSLLSVSVQFYSQPKIISRVAKESFWPKPKVESAIVKILINKNPPQINEGRFFSLLRAGFRQPRKYLLNNLVKGATIKKDKEELKKILAEMGKDQKVRPAELSVEDWIELYRKLIEIN